MELIVSICLWISKNCWKFPIVVTALPKTVKGASIGYSRPGALIEGPHKMVSANREILLCGSLAASLAKQQDYCNRRLHRLNRAIYLFLATKHKSFVRWLICRPKEKPPSHQRGKVRELGNLSVCSRLPYSSLSSALANRV